MRKQTAKQNMNVMHYKNTSGFFFQFQFFNQAQVTNEGTIMI